MLGRTKLADELADRIFAVGDHSQAANLAIRFGYCNSYRFGMDIQTQPGVESPCFTWQKP